jgi:hypothetical protein
MRAHPGWRQRVPSAFVALALQAALFALLWQSFPQMAPQPVVLVERIFLLSRPAPPPPVIDARRPPRAAPAPSGAPPAAAPELPPTPPPYAQAPHAQTPSLLTALGRAFDCQPDKKGRPSPLVSCRKPESGARNELAALSAETVRREDELAVERAISRIPPRVPCVALESYKIGGGGGAEDHIAWVDPLCVLKELRQ